MRRVTQLGGQWLKLHDARPPPPLYGTGAGLRAWGRPQTRGGGIADCKRTNLANGLKLLTQRQRRQGST